MGTLEKYPNFPTPFEQSLTPNLTNNATITKFCSMLSFLISFVLLPLCSLAADLPELPSSDLSVLASSDPTVVTVTEPTEKVIHNPILFWCGVVAVIIGLIIIGVASWLHWYAPPEHEHQVFDPLPTPNRTASPSSVSV